MSHDDFEFEPVRGLPAMLPQGETLLWQGSPRWQSLVVRSYHVRKVAIYFGALMVWRSVVGIENHHTVAAVAASCLFLLALGAIAIGVLSLLGYLNARSTVYSLTTHRLLLRHGVAVPLTLNLPLRLIESVDLRNFADGTGDVSLQLAREQRIGYLITWPHLRTGRITHPVPSFRALSDAKHAASLLRAALIAESKEATTTAAAAAPARTPGLEPTRPQFPAHTAAA
jgi:hypothetical protein